MGKKTATLDLTGCRYLAELHQRIKEPLDFPEYYGGNGSAFWDCISRDCDVDIVTIIGSSKVAEDLKPDAQTMIKILERNKQCWAHSDCPFDYLVVD